MHAVIISGGKQYRVTEGDTLKVEKLAAEVGSTIELDHVLMLIDGEKIRVGRPLLNGCKVSAAVVSQGRHKKVRIVKFRRRKHHLKWQGHRQYYTEVKITQIQAS
ncbi:MAG: 50S ribosomal protein L21 [Gammaproteobacteria bacterium RIFCSPHIGHO2_12_FULL_41_20]|nr:MAG: 50S ribosomal protein L21 [Gammaproteobacteria bacterium RIFCSPHIGHO2_12_FULL_41_20]